MNCKMKKILSCLFEPFGSLKDYWIAYGGLCGLLTSIYFWVAIILCLLLPTPKLDKLQSFINTVFPGILGFSLAALIMFLTFIAEKFDKKSKKISATFIHFVLIQSYAIILSYIFTLLEINNSFLLHLLHFLTLYAIFLIIAVTFALFELAKFIVDSK